MKDKSLAEETGPSKRAHGHNNWDPDCVLERFALLLKCNFASCGELVAAAGNATYDIDVIADDEGHYQQEWVRHYEPVALVPAPLPIRPVDKTPGAVKEALRTVWISTEAGPLPDQTQAIEVHRQLERAWGPDRRRSEPQSNQSFLFGFKK